MRRINFLVAFMILFIVVYSCDKKNEQSSKDTVLTGSVSILVDETILPVIEDQVLVFESKYKAKVSLIGKSETEIVKMLSQGKYNLAILTRELTKGEGAFFSNKKIKTRVTPLANDAIAFIANKSNEKQQIDLDEVIKLMKGQSSQYAGLVFDNPNSSTVKYFKDLAKLETLPKQKIFSFKNNNDVIAFVSKNKGMIGVVGVNWLMEPLPEFQKEVDNVSVLEVKSKGGSFVLPTQDLIASNTYPVTRVIKMLNYQGSAGLGTGFASFVAGETGQRIILKSGLVPVRMPSRNLIIRKEIEKKQ